MNLTNEDVQEILRLLDASPYDELHLETDRFKLTLRRSTSPQGGWTQENTTRRAKAQVTERLAAKAENSSRDAPSDEHSVSAPASREQDCSNMHAHAVQVAASQVAQTAAPTTPDLATRSTPGTSSELRASGGAIFEVRPPLIGTFYRAPKPGAAPFVEVGAQVHENTVVGIVETMKLMNSIYAGARGEVLEICAKDGELVEQDRILMRLRTTDL